MSNAPLDLDELKRVADAATDGPWCVDECYAEGGPPLGVYAQHAVDEFLNVLRAIERSMTIENAHHIATFDPPTVKALIARVRWLEEDDDHLGDAARVLQDERDRFRNDYFEREQELQDLRMYKRFHEEKRVWAQSKYDEQIRSNLELVLACDQLRERVAELEESQTVSIGVDVNQVELSTAVAIGEPDTFGCNLHDPESGGS